MFISKKIRLYETCVSYRKKSTHITFSVIACRLILYPTPVVINRNDPLRWNTLRSSRLGMRTALYKRFTSLEVNVATNSIRVGLGRQLCSFFFFFFFFFSFFFFGGGGGITWGRLCQTSADWACRSGVGWGVEGGGDGRWGWGWGVGVESGPGILSTLKVMET